MNNLNKENFWDSCKKEFPAAMKDFCNWIDDYKKQNDWGNLIGKKVKFHDLPLAMQMGIWNEYLNSYDLEKCKYDIKIMLWAFEEGHNERTAKS